jgi:hypothetical protein
LNVFQNYTASYFQFLYTYYHESAHFLSRTFRSLLSPQYSCFINNDFKKANNPSPPDSKNISNSSVDDKSPHLKIFYTNARSLLPKLSYLNNYLSISSPHIVGITETWLDSKTPSSFFCPRNYVAYRKDRSYSIGGGSLLLISNSLASAPVSIVTPELEERSKIDAIACQLPLKHGGHIGFLCVYRPPGLTTSDNLILYDIINNFLNHKFKFNVIIGDFNFPDIHWPVSSSSPQSDAFLSFMQENYLIQHVTSPTRKISKSILDLVLSTQGTEVYNLSVNEELGTSDHSIIEFCVPIRPKYMKKKMWIRNLRTADWSLFRQTLSSSPWTPVFQSTDIDVVWSRFLSILKLALDAVAPLRLVSVRYFVSSPKVRTALRHKRRLYKAVTESSTFTNIVAYQRSVEIVNKAIDDDLIKREGSILHNTNTKEFWSYVNRRLFKHPNIDHIKSINSDLIIDDPEVMTNTFNEYFASIFSKNSANKTHSTPAVSQLNTCTVFDTVSIQPEDIRKIMRLIPSKTTIDTDGLSYKVLKEGGLVLATYLTELFSLSLLNCRIPSAWKVGVVTPIYKGGSKELVTNYRPITVTSCCCRILERLVRNKLTDYLLTNKIINDTQHGFIAQKSTDTILLRFYDYVTDMVDRNMVVDTVFFDFAKAFDTIPHDLLISRLYSYGISGTILQWIADFLTNRLQMVCIGNASSNLLPVTSGVIQGSVLGTYLVQSFR